MPAKRLPRTKKVGTLREGATRIERWLHPFRPMFTAPTFLTACALALGGLLAIRERTVSAILRVLDWTGADGCRLHRFLSSAAWDPLAGSRMLLGLLIAAFAPNGDVVIGVDETIERRWGKKIKARGIYRDAVRSSKGFFVKTSGLRWMCFALLVHVPAMGGKRVALPFMTVLRPSEKADGEAGRIHRATAARAAQVLALAARWLPKRRIILVGDGGFGCQDLFSAARRLSKRRDPGHGVAVVARVRLDARFFDAPVPGSKDSRGRLRIVADRQPTPAERLADPASPWRRGTVPGRKGADGAERIVEVLDGTAVWSSHGHSIPVRWVIAKLPDAGPKTEPWVVASSDDTMGAAEMLGAYGLRWTIETAFQEVRRHLGVETQRQWTDAAIARTTPLLLALHSLVVLWASELAAASGGAVPLLRTWSGKTEPTFSDALAAVRRELWMSETVAPFRTTERNLRTSRPNRRSRQPAITPRPMAERLADLLVTAA